MERRNTPKKSMNETEEHIAEEQFYRSDEEGARDIPILSLPSRINYTEGIPNQRRQAIIDNDVLVNMASALELVDFRAIVRAFKNELDGLSLGGRVGDSNKSKREGMVEFIKLLDDTSAFHKTCVLIQEQKDKKE